MPPRKPLSPEEVVRPRRNRLPFEPGMRFGRLSAKREMFPEKTGRKQYRTIECRCDCGKTVVSVLSDLHRGFTRSCGCLRRERVSEACFKHGHSGRKTRIYWIWAAMIQRCTNPRNKSFHNYGGRGITVTDEWRMFDCFLRDMGPGYREGLSIERVDNSIGYSKVNCKWIPLPEQAKNRRPRSEWTPPKSPHA